MMIPIEKLPMRARRLAAQHLVSLQGTGMVRGTDRAALADHAVPVYRPDLDEVAYYEIAVVSGVGGRQVLSSRSMEGAAAKDAREANVATGFIVVTNGRHDFPISHWSLDREPPSRQVLGDDARCDCDGASPERAPAAKFYRLDVLSYAAEDAAGTLVGRSGQLPALIKGLPHRLARRPGTLRSASSVGVDRNRDDSDADGLRQDITLNGSDDTAEWAFVDAADWADYKKRYSDSFGPLLDGLRGQASRAWDLHDLIERFGEGISAGSTHRVALLGPAVVEIDGPAREFVRAELDDRGPGQSALVLLSDKVALRRELDLEVSLRYADGTSERLKFFLYSRDIPTDQGGARDHDETCDCKE